MTGSTTAHIVPEINVVAFAVDMLSQIDFLTPFTPTPTPTPTHVHAHTPVRLHGHTHTLGRQVNFRCLSTFPFAFS